MENENDNDRNFLLDVLESWGLGSYIDNFHDKNIKNKEELLRILLRDVDRIIPHGSNRLEFWNHWVPFFRQNVKMPDELDYVYSSNNVTVIRMKLLEECSKERIGKILNKHYESQCILKDYQEKKNFNYDNRIVEIIVRDVIDISQKYWTDDHYKEISESIINIFEGEQLETYYEPNGGNPNITQSKGKKDDEDDNPAGATKQTKTRGISVLKTINSLVVCVATEADLRTTINKKIL
ncbi:hypothetical protein HCN44_003497 [Aphidius gifuensis]|uniref:Uncharacterized protein n=1 Tax=Aphidius gifuensis TaxID=684658 RepID=A0A835CLS4_APHGI|nr:hypothetical protein HCN44_003497 [Aphidius gifuensis]